MHQGVVEMAGKATLTIRLSDVLRKELDRETLVSNRPLDSVVVDLIQLGLKLKESARQKSQWEREMEAITKTGLVEPLGEGWEEYLKTARGTTHGEVREMLAGLAPFSEDIIAERNEKR